jgi:hypothetical protein
MPNIPCPTCGHETAPDTTCPGCGHPAVNGVAQPNPVTPPLEVANWVIEPVTPEVREHFRRTFDPVEYAAAIKEVEENGGFHLEDFIDEIERITDGRE